MNNSVIQSRYKRLSDIPTLKNYTDYAVDVDGNVWSFKYNKCRRLSPGWAKKRDGYHFVRLSANGTKHNFFVHRLVAMAFLPTDDITLEVNHKNRNSVDNRIENLEWATRKSNLDWNTKVNGFSTDDFVLSKAREVHAASIRKGLPVPDSHEFINSLLEGALEQYINQYGLRKIMNTLPKP